MPDETFGTEPHKLHRTNDPITSAIAAESVDTNKYEKLVYDFIRAAGVQGVIQDDILRAYPDLPYSTLTARPSALIDKGLVVRLNEVRHGRSGRPQHVLVSWDNFAEIQAAPQLDLFGDR
jgi:hypothetical protein